MSTKKLTPEQSRLLKALRAAPLPPRFIARDVVHLVSGLAAQVNKELGKAIISCIGKTISPDKVGRLLALMIDAESDGLMLDRDFKKGSNKFVYTIHDLAAAPTVEDLLAPTEADEEDYLRIEKALSLPPAKAMRVLQPIETRKAREARQQAKEQVWQEEKEINAANRAHDRAQAKAAADAEAGLIQVWARKTYQNQDDATRVLERIAFGGKVISYKGAPPFQLQWLLPVDIAQAHQDLLILKDLAKENFIELALETVPVEVLLGKVLGSRASRNPADYEDYSARAATRLAMSGDMTTPLDFARRSRRNWSPFDPI